MHIKGKQLGRKLSTKMVVAEEERQRRKEVKQNRKYYKTKIKRAKIRKRLMRQDNFLEKVISRLERAFLPLNSAMKLFGVIEECLDLLGFDEVLVSGAARRGIQNIHLLSIVMVSDYILSFYPLHSKFQELMAERGFLILQDAEDNNTRNGASAGYYINGIKILFYITRKDTLGSVMFTTTGNDVFLKKVAYHAEKHLSMRLRKHGLYLGQELIASETEEHIFEELDMQYLSPENRCYSGKQKLIFL